MKLRDDIREIIEATQGDDAWHGVNTATDAVLEAVRGALLNNDDLVNAVGHAITDGDSREFLESLLADIM